MINSLKYFKSRFRVHRDIRIYKKLHGVNGTAESVCMNDTAETKCTPWNRKLFNFQIRIRSQPEVMNL